MESPQKPHAICIPFPAQGHINPMLKLALLLHHKGFHITFVHTHYNYNRLLQSRGGAAVAPLPDFQFATIPDGLPPPENADSTQDIPSLCVSTHKNCLEPINKLVDELNHHSPPVSCVIYDLLMSCALDAADRIGVPGVALQTAAACSFMCNKHIGLMMEKGILPLKDKGCLTNGYLETPVDCIPGVIPLRLKHLSSTIQTTDPNDPLLTFLLTQIARSSKAAAIIINTFHQLEHKVLTSLSPISPPIYTIGFLHLLLNRLPENHNAAVKSITSSLWKEDPTSIQWLDSKPENSVIYVNFGSVAVLTPKQMSEFAWGLAGSGVNFLWVFRPDLVLGNADLPPEFWEETAERGFVAGWCSQERALCHPAVGGFLTHCGWNSVVESLAGGVPMLCWPFFADQSTNCRYVCDEWGVGMEIGDRDVKRDEVASLVRELMDGERGEVLRRRAAEWMGKAAAAIAGGGSSDLNLERLVNEVLLC